MAKLNENQTKQLNILRESVKAIATSIHIIELQPGEGREASLICGIEEMLIDCTNAVSNIKRESNVNPIFQNILNSLS